MVIRLIARTNRTVYCFILYVILLPLFSTVALADTTLAVDSPGATFSPANWAGDAGPGGRGGSKFRVTWNVGAWCRWSWKSEARGYKAKLLITNQTTDSGVSYFLDGNMVDNAKVPAEGGINIEGITDSNEHTLLVVMRNSQQLNRWDRRNAFKVSGLVIDADATPIRKAVGPWILIVGDSITEGNGAAIANGKGGDSSLSDYSFLVGQGLERAGFEYSVSACGYSGWIHAGCADDDVPPYFAMKNGQHDPGFSRWDKIDSTTSLTDEHQHISGWGEVEQEPVAIVYNYGTNEAIRDMNKTDYASSVRQGLKAVHHAAPDAKIIVLVPPGLYNAKVYPFGKPFIDLLKTGANEVAHSEKGGEKITLVDLGPEVANALASPAYGGGVHPNAAGHAYLAPLILQAVLEKLPAERR